MSRTPNPWLLRLYGCALRLYPPRFRARFGDDMLQLFRDRCRDETRRGWLGTIHLLSSTAVDVITHAAAERRTEAIDQRNVAAIGGEPMGLLVQDMRQALRGIARRRGFTAVALLVLALGIGANVAIFSVVDAVLLKPLPYPDPDRLVRINGTSEKVNERPENISRPDFLDFARLSTSFESLGAHGAGVGGTTLTGVGEPERIDLLVVSSGYFRTLGARAALGRIFLPEEDAAKPPDVVVLSESLWRTRFASDPNIIGKTIMLADEPNTVVGVLAAGFRHPALDEDDPQIYAPMSFDPKDASRSGRSSQAVGRLRAGVTLEAAQAELSSIAAQLERDYPTENFQVGVLLRSLHAATTGNSRVALLVLLAAVGLVLLVACANLANLLLAGAAGRQREMAIRTALGAGRAQIIRQLLTESVLLSILGGIAGLVVAQWTIGGLLQLGASSIPRADGVKLDGMVLAYGILLSCVTGVIFGLAPALQSSRADVQDCLKANSRGSSPGMSRHRLRNGLIVAEVALSIILLVSAALLMKSFWRLSSVDPGFAKPESILTARMALPIARYEEGTQIPFYQRLYERISGLPGVRSVGGTNILPFSGDYSCDGFQVDERPLPPGQNSCAEVRSVSPDYFTAMGVPLLQGRQFAWSDNESSSKVVIINETMAREFWPGENALGKTMTYDGRGQVGSREIVGIIGDVHHFGLATKPVPEFYTPEGQQPSFHGMILVIRTDSDPETLIAAVRAQLKEMDPLVPLTRVTTMRSMVSSSVAEPRFRTLLLGGFAALALLLAVIGVYGVIAVAVSQRTQELGIRVALGASARQLLKLMVGQGMRPVVVGVIVGLAGAWGAARLISSLLFGVTPNDPAVFLGVPAILVLAALFASWLPARRAARIDPVLALRCE